MIPFSREHQKALFYIGITSRKFKERLKEHLSDIKFNKPSTALSRLHQEENSKINFDKAKMIISTSNNYSSIIVNPLRFYLGVILFAMMPFLIIFPRFGIISYVFQELLKI